MKYEAWLYLAFVFAIPAVAISIAHLDGRYLDAWVGRVGWVMFVLMLASAIVSVVIWGMS